MKTKYILVEWPECQCFEENPHFTDCYWAADGMFLFVPEKLYNQVILETANSEFDYGHDVDYTTND